MISRSRLSCSKRRHRIGGAEVRSAIVAACVKGGRRGGEGDGF